MKERQPPASAPSNKPHPTAGPSGQELRQRTREIALRDGRNAAEVSLADYEQAKRELLGSAKTSPNP